MHTRCSKQCQLEQSSNSINVLTVEFCDHQLIGSMVCLFIVLSRNTDSSKRWPTMKEITDPKGPFFPKWRMIFIVSCLFAVLLDPLFLYIPMINDDAKCMSLDRNLKIAAPVFRMVTDVFYILNIILQVYKSKKWLAFINAFRSGSCSSVLSNLRSISPSIAKTMWKSYILIDVFAVLPLPQVREGPICS